MHLPVKGREPLILKGSVRKVAGTWVRDRPIFKGSPIKDKSCAVSQLQAGRRAAPERFNVSRSSGAGNGSGRNSFRKMAVAAELTVK